MGRSSKFSFPMPGRKHAASKAAPKPHYGVSGNAVSKAQRVLGADSELNIDSPNRDDDGMWRARSDMSDGMSIAISETSRSYQSVEETDVFQDDQWDHESGVLPRTQQLHERPSSTLLGRRYGTDGYGDESSVSRGLRNEDSSSTLKSYYDRQKIPLAISQQTSASSARDLALRKGFPPVVTNHPPSRADRSDRYNKHAPARNAPRGIVGHADAQGEVPKRPSRLDLSSLFPRSRKSGLLDSPSLPASASSATTNVSRHSIRDNFNSARRILAKATTPEPVQIGSPSIRSNPSHDPLRNDLLHSLYDHYEQAVIRSPRMGQIPESSSPEAIERNNLRTDNDSHPKPRKHRSPKQPTLKPDCQSHRPRSGNPITTVTTETTMKQMISPRPWDTSSAASVSSHNTRASRVTANSVFSTSDLKNSSVLSLSSESEGEESRPDPVTSSPPVRRHQRVEARVGVSRPAKGRRQTSQEPANSQGTVSRRDTARNVTRDGKPFLTIPTASKTNTRSSGPLSSMNARSSEPDNDLHGRRATSQTSSRAEQRSTKPPPSIASIASGGSCQQHTPPLSPSSATRQDSADDSRYMAVTKQEEALLEALRQKRARMRKAIIEEHETAKTPPRYLLASIPNSQFSETSSQNSSLLGTRNSTAEKGEILLYLDAPVVERQNVELAEPSPDLSDFLSFGSDEDSTPRTSWALTKAETRHPKRNKARTEKAHHSQRARVSPTTPPSAARLSAVGGVGGGRVDPVVLGDGGVVGLKKRAILATGVRFMDEGKLVNPGDFLADDEEEELVWGL